MYCELIVLLLFSHRVTMSRRPSNTANITKRKKTVTVLTENSNHDKEIKCRYM